MMLPMSQRPPAREVAPALRLVPRGDPPAEDEERLLRGLRADEAWARRQLFERYSPVVERTLRRVLGHERHEELGDLIHDCFVEAFTSVGRLREPRALQAWMRSVAANTARHAIRRRRARRWLLFWEPQALPHPPTNDVSPEVRDAFVRTYALLDSLSAEQRVAFVLRHIEGLSLAEVAEALDVSLATIKRKLGRAERRFVAMARRDPVLQEWIEEGGRWAT